MKAIPLAGMAFSVFRVMHLPASASRNAIEPATIHTEAERETSKQVEEGSGR